jgi:hypothetical protein
MQSTHEQRAGDGPEGDSPGAPLTIARYDAAEMEARAGLSIPHFMAFRPVAFESVGWPTRISQEAELLRYVDHNFEAEVPGLYKSGATSPNSPSARSGGRCDR